MRKASQEFTPAGWAVTNVVGRWFDALTTDEKRIVDGLHFDLAPGGMKVNVTVTYKPERTPMPPLVQPTPPEQTPVPAGKPMGRIHSPDARDFTFRARTLQPLAIGAPVRRRKHRYFLPPANGDWRSQGNEQSCTEHALTNKLCGWPNPRHLTDLPWQQHQLYRARSGGRVAGGGTRVLRHQRAGGLPGGA